MSERREALDRTRLSILVVDDDPAMQEVFEACFAADDHLLEVVSRADGARQRVEEDLFDLAFVDLRLEDESGLDLIPDLLARNPWLKVVVVTGHGSIDTAVEAMRRGAADYLTKPFEPTRLRVIAERTSRVRKLEDRVRDLELQVERLTPPPFLDTANPEMRRALSVARQVAETDATVLLRGESGTGKGVLAQAIHDWSERRNGPFSEINCPSLSTELLRSELFGHVKGAFTGAVRTKPGKITVTDGGTLFLDEIGDLPGDIQPQLLRFLQSREYERLGDPQTRRADVRIICATNRDLDRAIESGSFREDLYYRLRVIEIFVPPLRERPQDIRTLADRFLDFFAAKYSRSIRGFSAEARDRILEHSWPGNVRELQNAIERAVILCRSDEIGTSLLPLEVSGPASSPLPGSNGLVSLKAMEKRYIEHVLANTGSIEEAAEVLDVAPSTLWRRRRKYGI